MTQFLILMIVFFIFYFLNFKQKKCIVNSILPEK